MTYLESGNLQIFTEAADIRKITADLYDKWQDKVSPDVIFTYGVADNVPTALMLDIKRVKQCMRNLVSNAIKFTSAGRIHVHITVQNADLSPGDTKNVQALSIIVADTGIGIDDKLKANLFTSSTARDCGGARIDLALTRKFARLMGGDVVVTSKHCCGSEFALSLKTIDVALAARQPDTGIPIFSCVATEDRGEDHGEDQRQRHAASFGDLQEITPKVESVGEKENQRAGFSRRTSRPDDQPVTPDQLDGLNILIAEDVIANQEVVRSLLEPAGCTVSLASNGRQALELLKDQVFDVILMDIRMPIMGGIEATEIIRATQGPHQNIPIIALTADASAENNAQCLAAGADVFLTKPVIVSELFASIRFVRTKKQRNANQQLSA